jgi:CMP-N,N'-diacetyllegionaminic acid synthase
VSVIALIPARSGSKGIPGKNLRQLGGLSLMDHALLCARRAGIPAFTTFLSTDYPYREEPPHPEIAFRLLKRPPALAQDDTPMIEVVQHALTHACGDPDDIICLLQPTQPFRKPEHVQQAMRLLQETQADSVVSVVALPLSHSPEMLLAIDADGLLSWLNEWAYVNDFSDGTGNGWEALPTRRQDARPAYMRDGTCYVFWRRTAERWGTIYGQDVRPLLIDPADSCELDTELDWAACVRRWQERHGGA